MILKMCRSCGACHDGDCKPIRKAAPNRAAPVRNTPSKIEREISKFPKAIQDQIRAKLK